MSQVYFRNEEALHETVLSIVGATFEMAQEGVPVATIKRLMLHALANGLAAELDAAELDADTGI
jgi:hypothetical protein